MRFLTDSEKYKKGRRGQSIVELALVFPFFLLIIIGGIVDFGFAFNSIISLQQLANDTAQWAATHDSTEQEIIEYASSRKSSSFTGYFSVCLVERINLVSGGQVIKVGLGYDSPAYTPFYKIMLKSTMGSEFIRIEAQAAYKIPEFVKPPRNENSQEL